MKKIISLLLVCCMMICALPMSASAAKRPLSQVTEKTTNIDWSGEGTLDEMKTDVEGAAQFFKEDMAGTIKLALKASGTVYENELTLSDWDAGDEEFNTIEWANTQFTETTGAAYIAAAKEANDGKYYVYGKCVEAVCFVDKNEDGVLDDSEKAYLNYNEALDDEDTVAGDVIRLLDDVCEKVTYSKNVVIALDGHKLSDNQCASTLKILITSETDMENALKIAPRETRQTWEIANDITLSKNVRIRDRYVTIHGNDYTIKGASGAGDLLEASYLQMFAIDSVKYDSRNHVKFEDINLVCSDRFKNVIAVQNKDDENNYGMNLTLENVTIKHVNCQEDGAAILNFGSTIKVKGQFKLEVGEKSCYGIGMDLEKDNASLNFDNEAKVILKDGRTKAQKEARPFIFFSNRYEGHTATVSGDFADEKLVKVDDTPDIPYGYDLEKNQCKYPVALAEGQDAQVLMLNGKEAGEYVITGNNCDGYTLKDANGKYIAFANTAVVPQSDSSYTWKYDGGLYAEVKKTTTKKILFWTKKKTTKTKYYLSFDGENLLLSNSKVCANVQATEDEHDYCYANNFDGTHDAICKNCKEAKIEAEEHDFDVESHQCVCGALDPKYNYVSDVIVDVEKKTVKTTKNYWSFKKTTSKSVYEYTITFETKNVCVKKVEYSGDNKEWNTGKVFKSDIELNKVYIRVTDSEGTVTNWVYSKGEVSKVLSYTVGIIGEYYASSYNLPMTISSVDEKQVNITLKEELSTIYIKDENCKQDLYTVVAIGGARDGSVEKDFTVSDIVKNGKAVSFKLSNVTRNLVIAVTSAPV